MDNFLQYVAKYLHIQHGSNLASCCVVVPNRRSGLFLLKFLSDEVKKATWAPEILTINDFMRSNAPYQMADDILLISRLYSVYRKHIPNAGTFDEFYSWGEILLNDFDDLDKYRMDTQSLFKNLMVIKDFEKQFNFLTENQVEAIKTFWGSFNAEKISGNQKDFVEIWQKLDQIFSEFKATLVHDKIAFEGMIYRYVAENIHKVSISLSDRKKYIVVGLNALNPCEETLLDELKKLGIADFLWDYDHYYLDDVAQEAGTFLRRNIVKYPPPQHWKTLTSGKLYHHLSNKTKNVTVISCPTEISQAKYLATLLYELEQSIGENPNNSAVVLANEKLLQPVLYSCSDIKNVNITMGYPLKDTAICTLLRLLIEMHRKCLSDKSGRFHYKDVLASLNHPLILSLKNEEIKSLRDKIVVHNKLFLTAEDFPGEGLAKDLFKTVETPLQLADYLMKVMLLVQSGMSPSEPNQRELEVEFFYHAQILINRLKDLVISLDIELSVLLFCKLLNNLLSQKAIPFSGEPLHGLQIMGFLETRGLDFKNLIFLSMNDSVVPGSSVSASFIPYNLRKGFGLPTIEYRDAMYAYYFYRAIQRAENVVFVYNADSSGSVGERSRFLLQLKYESNFQLDEKVLNYTIGSFEEKNSDVPKGELFHRKMAAYLSGDKQLSPSGLLSYMDCGLRFYFRYIAGLKESEEFLEEVDLPLFGNLFHKAMYLIYKPYIKSTLTEEKLTQLQADHTTIEQCILQAFADDFFATEFVTKDKLTGKNSIIFSILKKYCIQVIEVDKKQTPFTILVLEEKHQVPVNFTIDGIAHSVIIGGVIDRVDQVQDRTRIIDYKSGQAGSVFTSLESLFDKSDGGRNKAVFQTLLYSYMYQNSNHQCMNMEPAIYPLRQIFEDNQNFSVRQSIKRGVTEAINAEEMKPTFMALLITTLEELFNPTLNFQKTDKPEHCTYCAYNGICN